MSFPLSILNTPFALLRSSTPLSPSCPSSNPSEPVTFFFSSSSGNSLPLDIFTKRPIVWLLPRAVIFFLSLKEKKTPPKGRKRTLPVSHLSSAVRDIRANKKCGDVPAPESSETWRCSGYREQRNVAMFRLQRAAKRGDVPATEGNNTWRCSGYREQQHVAMFRLQRVTTRGDVPATESNNTWRCSGCREQQTPPTTSRSSSPEPPPPSSPPPRPRRATSGRSTGTASQTSRPPRPRRPERTRPRRRCPRRGKRGDVPSTEKQTVAGFWLHRKKWRRFGYIEKKWRCFGYIEKKCGDVLATGKRNVAMFWPQRKETWRCSGYKQQNHCGLDYLFLDFLVCIFPSLFFFEGGKERSSEKSPSEKGRRRQRRRRQRKAVAARDADAAR